MADNVLYYGDNLDIMRRYIKDESVDLVYLDPPFNSNQTYNVLYAEHSGLRSAAQIKAFDDTWHWGDDAAEAYQDVVEVNDKTSEAMRAFWQLLGASDMMAYLAMMAPRLVELGRVMKPTASLYLHCDPTASHYLKLLLDAVFGPIYFRSEIIWKRTSAHSGAKRWGSVHDVILFYTKSETYTWNALYQPLPQETADAWYNNIEDGTLRRFNRADLTAAGTRNGPSGAVWRGIDPTAKGRHWAIPGFVGAIVAGLETLDALDALDAANRIFWPKRTDGTPMVKRYLDESQGIPAQDVISDIYVNNTSGERLGYPTQKPEALLERIIKASSNEGDTVLDPFCGCGTAVVAAQRLKRRWKGIDITPLAISLIKHRLQTAHEDRASYTVIGEPVSLPDAEYLAKSNPNHFELWALGLVGARQDSKKKGADRGIDGRLYFHDDLRGAITKQIIFSVKAGHVTVSQVRDLRGVIEREKAQIGVLISFEQPTQPIQAEATSAGFYESPSYGRFPRLQLLTVGQLLVGERVKSPPLRQTNVTFKKAPRVKGDDDKATTLALPWDDDTES